MKPEFLVQLNECLLEKGVLSNRCEGIEEVKRYKTKGSQKEAFWYTK